MRKRKTMKSSAAALLATPPPPPPPSSTAAQRSPPLSPTESPAVEVKVNLDRFKKSNKNAGAGPSASKVNHPTTGLSPSQQGLLKRARTVSDLKNLASSNLDSMRRKLEQSHSDISKDTEAWHRRFQKRMKVYTHACQNLMDEIEKQYQRMSEQINEDQETMKVSFAELIAEA